MLQSLHVHNFALLEDAQVDFAPGFNVFTGETGAGKSILVDAFGVVLGSRASADYIRSGEGSFWVQAVFDISRLPKVKAMLAEQDIDADDDLFLKRQLTASGKSKATINGVQVPLNTLRQIAGCLVDIHGQHENQALLKADAPRILIDNYGGAELKVKLDAYADCYGAYTAAVKRLAALNADNSQQDILLDRYAWEIKEITDAHLKVGEEETLEEEARILQNSEKIIGYVDAAYKLLDDEKGVLNLLARAKNALISAGRYDNRLAGHADSADSAWITLDDCRQELGEYLASSDFNGERATQVQQRLDVIYRLYKKYGGSTEAVLEYLTKVQSKYDELNQIADAIEKAEKELATATGKLKKAAGELSSLRKKYAKKLAGEIERHIHDLAMPNGVFAIAFKTLDKFTPAGSDDMRFMFSANIGEPVNELERVASGGELSRIALAIKTVMASDGDVPVMVFDEIDTGVGGVTAQKMAEKIAHISRTGQVLCITHLPQIAAFADRHIYIEKRSAEGRTATMLTVLEGDARVAELVRMTAGANTSQAATDNARELLAAANKVKQAK